MNEFFLFKKKLSLKHGQSTKINKHYINTEILEKFFLINYSVIKIMEN